MAQLRSDIAATAELQTASPFFNKLPFEIREKIFDELWALHDTRWHVHSAGEHVVPVFPCITGPDEEDTRYSHFQTSRGSDALAWESRLRSPWNTHWRCAEAAAARATNPRTGRTASPRDYIRRRPSFATSSSPLLVCKRWYVPYLLDCSTTDIVQGTSKALRPSRTPLHSASPILLLPETSSP